MFSLNPQTSFGLVSSHDGQFLPKNCYLFIYVDSLFLVKTKVVVNNKKAMGLDWQNNNFVRASRFFVHFFAVVARLQRETSYFHVLSRT